MNKYSIPENINKLIDEEFLHMLKYNIDIIYESKIGELNVEDYASIAGNNAWYKALLNTCFELKKLQIIKYGEEAAWYDSDSFDGAIVYKMVELGIIK